MKTKIFTLFVALIATTTLWAQNNVITYTAMEKIKTSFSYPPRNILNPNKINVSIISHDFSNGQGVITFSGTITTIEYDAFENCSGITSITIPSSVTKIESNSLSMINNVVYNGPATGAPWSAKYVNGYVEGNVVYSDSSKTTLCGCPSSNTGEFTISNSVTTIGKWAFNDCYKISSIYIPNSVKIISDGAFYRCTALTSVIIPNSVTTIGNYAFEGCSGLTSITIPNSVTTIGDRAFYECTGLTSVTIPNSVTTIGEWAFKSCTGLISVTIPNSVTTIGEDAFRGVVIVNYNGTASGSPWGAKCVNGCIDNFLIYPDASKTKLCGCLIEAIGEIIIPNTVTEIEEKAFYRCSGITSIIMGYSVTKIGEMAFSGCNSLSEVHILDIGAWCNISFAHTNAISYGDNEYPSNPLSFAANLYLDNQKITDVVIPSSVTNIKGGAFYRFRGLKSVTIPNSVTTIASRAFAYCSGLSSINIPRSVTSVSNDAFDHCTSLPIIDGIRYADTYLLNAVDRTLSTYTIKEGTRWIGFEAFRDCSNMTSITIPKSIESISSDVFKRCTSLPVIDGIRYADTYLIEAVDKTLSSYSIREGTRWIGSSAFNRCTNLTSITIPYSVISLGGGAFYDCFNLTTITIPNWISVGYNCFGHSSDTSIKGKTIYVILSPFEYSSNPENLISENIKRLGSKYDDLTYIPQYAEVATWTTTPTTIEMDIDLTNIPTTHLYDSISIDYFGEENDIENILTPSTQNHVIFTGLTPNQKANIYYTSKKIGEDDWEEGARLEIQLPKLNFTTLVPKVVSAGTAIVAAETNISDYETNVGFEWRKYDAPESMPSKSGTAILFNGIMEGKLLNLSTDAYWNVRPYYEAADGTRYYGEWITFDPSDFSYFEPTVHTYALATSPTANKVQVRGYVMTGTDDVTEQGFEYWFKGGQKAPHRIPNATADSVYRVTASGQVMTAVLEDLAYSSTYTCRAYAIAGGKTYYGEEVQFLTPEDPRPIYTLTVIAGENGSVNTEVSGQYREGEQVTLTATPNVGYLFEQWSDGNTENPYILTIMQDTEITATFKQAESGLTNLPCNIKATKYFHNGNLIIERNGVKYTATGQKVR